MTSTLKLMGFGAVLEITMLRRDEDPGSFFYVLDEPVQILFADDDAILREFAVVHLSTNAARIETVEDGAVALEYLENNACDILLLDLDMPNLNGFDVLKRLRGSEKYRQLPVIVVTGREDVSAIDRAFSEGASSFIVKPINWRLLSYQIRFVHRAALAEASLIAARSKARGETAKADARVRKLAAEGARFLGRALAQAPQLRAEATSYVSALEEAGGAQPPANAA